MAEPNNPGEDKAWQLIAERTPADVCSAALVTYDASTNSYTVPMFGMDIRVSLDDRQISSAAPGGQFLLQRQAYFSRLSVLWYLAGAKDIPLAFARGVGGVEDHGGLYPQ